MAAYVHLSLSFCILAMLNCRDLNKRWDMTWWLRFWAMCQELWVLILWLSVGKECFFGLNGKAGFWGLSVLDTYAVVW